MKTLLLAIFLLTAASPAYAGLDDKIAASFAAKYEICSNRLKHRKGYFLRSLAMRAESDRINRKHLGERGYLKALKKEKKKARDMPLRKCKKISNRFQ